MQVTVISPERSVYEGEADSVVVTAFDGKVGILPNHAPLMTLLGDGDMIVKNGQDTYAFHVSGGFLQVVNDSVRVVAEQASPVE